jgi:hypothetical protein
MVYRLKITALVLWVWLIGNLNGRHVASSMTPQNSEICQQCC